MSPTSMNVNNKNTSSAMNVNNKNTSSAMNVNNKNTASPMNISRQPLPRKQIHSTRSKPYSQTDIIIKEIKENFEVSFSYSEINSVMRLVKKLNLEVLKTDFQIECKLIFAVKKNNMKYVHAQIIIRRFIVKL